MVGMCLTLMLKAAALASLPVEMAPTALMAAHCAARWTCLPLTFFLEVIQVPHDASLSTTVSTGR